MLNRLGYLPDRTAALRRTTLTPSEGGLNLSQIWADRRVLVAERHVVPFLRRLVAPETKSRPDVVGSALIALAKTSQAPDLKDLILHRLRDKKAPVLVRESAALAAGLLARSKADHQQNAADLDEIRDGLIEAYDDGDTPYQARVFAALSLGLLADQPYSDAYAKDGRLVVRALWKRLEMEEPHAGITAGLLTALGMQPSRGVPDAVREGLRRIVSGRRELGRKWSAADRSHALTAVLRIGGSASLATLRRTILRRREHVAVRRAAYVAVGHLAEKLSTADKVEITAAIVDALRRDRDPLTTGLGHLALGHLLGADLRAGSVDVLARTPSETQLLRFARNGPTPSRGFSALALALAIRGVEAKDLGAGKFAAEGRRLLVEELRRGRGDDRMQSAYAVAVGLAGIGDAAETLMEIIDDRHADPALRGHAAVALGQVGRRGPEHQRALFVALAQRRYAELRRQAALGLALLGGRTVGTQLVKELETSKTEQSIGQIVISLGRLGDLKAVAPLVEFAADKTRSELSQALSVVALGMLSDPEPRPTLLILTQNANYPARTDALHEAYGIL